MQVMQIHAGDPARAAWDSPRQARPVFAVVSYIFPSSQQASARKTPVTLLSGVSSGLYKGLLYILTVSTYLHAVGMIGG